MHSIQPPYNVASQGPKLTWTIMTKIIGKYDNSVLKVFPSPLDFPATRWILTATSRVTFFPFSTWSVSFVQARQSQLSNASTSTLERCFHIQVHKYCGLYEYYLTLYMLRYLYNIIALSGISHHPNGTGGWNPNSRTCLYYTVNVMAADYLAMKGPLVLTLLSQKILAPALEGLSPYTNKITFWMSILGNLSPDLQITRTCSQVWHTTQASFISECVIFQMPNDCESQYLPY